MKVPVEITYRHCEKTVEVDDLIRGQVQYLERVCPSISSCRIAIEDEQGKHSGNTMRVRIDITVPPGHEIVVKRVPTKENQHSSLGAIIMDAFEAATRQLTELEKRRHEHHRDGKKINVENDEVTE